MKESSCSGGGTDHQWTETQWDTTRTGIFYRLCSIAHLSDSGCSKFNQFLHSKRIKQGYHCWYSHPHTSSAPHTQLVPTDAYAIEVVYDHSVQMLLVPKTLLNVTTALVPHSMLRRKKHPVGYERQNNSIPYSPPSNINGGDPSK
jgi:hypothetical protein